ncbi:Nuclear pore complex protein Nup98-Nup96 [Phytophthora citrophthora]|uniref:Nuclear pore complex protein Nup98-Nup96 n=1 Tax=Phytophthora citrophthora TaxID=4793 RepID=A0AAD9FYX6_9STRA|nr:Nuclear pore complex protein Nup98-Nup96 [Phytophthora citrophthora]
MSFGGFGSTSTPASGGFGGFGSAGTSGGFGSSAAASPFGGGAATGGFGSGTSTFGAGAAKPAFGGFGAAAPATGGGFGTQQTTTTGFGGFGAAAAPTTGFGAAAPATTSGFGAASAFGGGATPGGFGSSGTSAFGASTPFGAKPAASSSPFGAASTFGGGAGTTSTFGGAATTGGFGTPAPASGGMFGNTSGGFGASAAKSPFGATSTATTGGFGSQPTGTTGFGGFGAQPAAAPATGQVQVGTGQPAYQPTREMEPSGTGGTANYVSISRMPAYSHKSTEELRYEDYLKRTNPAAAQAAATQNAPAPGATTGGTGAFGGFGSQPTTSSAFGTTGGFGTNQPSAFGATSTTGGFGSSAFGSTTTAPTTGGFGGFGSQAAAPATSGGVFGNTAARPTTGAFGAPATSSAFGATPGATSAFGAPATGGGFGATTGGFGSSFGAAPAAQPQTGGFGGFGSATPAASSGFGASAFGKPAASGGFGSFGATATPAAAPATGGFGFGAAQPQTGATTSLFGGAPAAAPASTGFSFGATAPKPATTGGFGFGSTGGTNAFGSTTGSAFGAAAPSAFGAAPAQPTAGATSLFGSTTGATGSTGGFGFGATPSTTPGAGTSLFGAAKPATTSLFGSTAGSTTTGGLFSNTAGAGGSSLFGGTNTATNTGATGFGFGTGGGFGSTTTGGFGGFGAAATPAAPTGGFGATGSLFGQAQQPAQTAAAQPQNLVAAPDVNPYGAGSFGAGLVEQNVKAALDLQSIKTGSSASSRLTTFADDVGLPRGPLDPPLVTRRQTVSNRHAIPVSFIRGSFKGSRSRFSTFTSPSLSSALSSGVRAKSESSNSGKDDEFKFTSSLFRNSVTKKLVINKGDKTSGRGNRTNSHVSVVPLTDNDYVDLHEIGSAHTRLLKPSDDGKYSVSFCNQTNKKSFSLRLYPNQTVKQARSEVKQLLRESSASAVSSIIDIELVLRGRIVHDNSTIDELQLKELDSIDVVVIENRAENKEHEAQSASVSSLTKKPDAQPNEEAVPPKRFMTYDEYLASASHDEDDLFKDTEANRTSSVSPASSSCPMLKNKDYYTIPSYERLQAMADHELSQVEKFTVGCRGLGAVEWIGKTDVRDLDLDELVYFEKKEVIVYKDDTKKHELGKGLNKPAVVELLGIFPPRKSASPEKYKERVKQRTQDIGATFLDYSIEKGIWRFRVEHFSRYGFDDDDDEEEDVDMDGHDRTGDASNTELHVDQLSRKPGMTRGPVVRRGVIPFSAERSGLFRQSGIYGGEVNSSSVVVSFGEHNTPSAASDKWTGMSDDSESVGPLSEPQMDFNVEEAVVATKKVQRPTSEVFPMIPYSLKPLGVNSVDRLQPREKSTTYQMMLQASNQGQSKVVRNHVDGGMFMARSFRCSWGPNGELVNLGKLVSRPEDYLNVDNKGRRISIEFPLRLSETRKSDIHDGLKLHYEYSSKGRSPDDFVDRDGSEVPAQFALPVHGPLMSCLHQYVAHAENRVKKSLCRSSEERTLLVWRLIQSLWGQEHGAKLEDRPDSAFYPLASRDDPNEVENLDTFQTVDLRREAISQWFEIALKDAGNAGTFDSTPSLEGVLSLLCQHRIAEASEMAMECGDFRLATLIAQAASYESNDFRSLMETQMAQWSENGSLEFMDKTLVLIYSALAGSVEVLTAQKGANMSWIMCLAMFLWYKRGPATPLKSALAVYEDAVSKKQASGSLSLFAPPETGKDDVLMELMKLYIEDAASLCKVLSPSGFMSQDTHHLDYELSWHLYSVLRAIGYKLDREWESHIQQNFIRQLEGAGLWEDAVYVALNISDVIERENTCRELLFRNADVLASDISKREQLCERFNLPAEWISEALAVRAVAKLEYHEEIAHWMAARHYEEAHACLIAHVAMRCLFSNEKSVLMELLLDMEPMTAYIPQWKSCDKVDTVGGGLLLEYLRLEQQKGLEVGHEDQFIQRIMLLSQQLSSARDASAKDASKKRETNALLAQTCVSSMIVSLATQAVQLRSLLSYTQEREFSDDASSSSTPLELEPEFLGGLAHLVTGRETSFVESYRTSQLMHLCSTFIDWRA